MRPGVRSLSNSSSHNLDRSLSERDGMARRSSNLLGDLPHRHGSRLLVCEKGDRVGDGALDRSAGE